MSSDNGRSLRRGGEKAGDIGSSDEARAGVAKVISRKNSPIKAPRDSAEKAGYTGVSDEARAEVTKVISRKHSAIQRCYGQALRDNPDEGGRVTVTFTVGTAGTVTAVATTGASGPFADCVKNEFIAIRGLPLLPAPQSYRVAFVGRRDGD